MEKNIFHLYVNKKFLSELNNLTKMSIKVYISLAFLQYKRGGYFTASHSEISGNTFTDYNYNESFYIRTDAGQYFKAFKQLERLGLIKVHRRKTLKGGNLPNQYNVY